VEIYSSLESQVELTEMVTDTDHDNDVNMTQPETSHSSNTETTQCIPSKNGPLLSTPPPGSEFKLVQSGGPPPGFAPPGFGAPINNEAASKPVLIQGTLPISINQATNMGPPLTSVPIINSPLNPNALKFQSNPVELSKSPLLAMEPAMLGQSPGRFDLEQTNMIEAEEEAGTPLHTEWTFYRDKAPQAGASLDDYAENLRAIYTVSTIEGFWQVFNNLPVPSKLPPRFSYHLMRGTRKPVWEDPLVENGGCWKLKVIKRDTDTVWKELLLAAIGEQFNNNVSKNDSVIGISVSVRDRDDQFQVWNFQQSEVDGATVPDKILNELCPKVKFNAHFYKAHKQHHKFEKDSHDKVNRPNNYASSSMPWTRKQQAGGTSGTPSERNSGSFNNSKSRALPKR